MKKLSRCLLTSLLLFSIGCDHPPPPPDPLVSVAHIGQVPPDLTRAVRIRYAELDWPEPVQIAVAPSETHSDLFLVTVDSEDGRRQFVGELQSNRTWNVFEAGHGFMAEFGLPFNGELTPIPEDPISRPPER